MPKKHEVSPEQLKQCASVMQAARIASGISQRELSRRINVTQPLISSWEKGKSLPAINHLVEIETALGVAKGSVILAIAYGDTPTES